jgi:hypothetical protein
MQSIKEILEGKNKIAYKTRTKSSYNPKPPEEFYEMVNKVDALSSDTRTLIDSADPLQIDSHDPKHIVINLDGYSNEKIGNQRYLIQLVVYLSGETVDKSFITGMLNGFSGCYIKNLVGSVDKQQIVSYQKAKSILK